MLRLSKLTDYAIVVLSRLPKDMTVQTSAVIAGVAGLPEPTVSKVLKALAGSQLVVSQRGARGGYQLGRPLGAISVADVVAAIDGPLALVACIEGSNAMCEAEGSCPVRGRWEPVNDAVHRALASISIADIEASRPKPPRADVSRSPAGPASTPADPATAFPTPVPSGAVRPTLAVSP